VTLGPLERLDGRRPESFVRLGSILLLVGLFGVGTALYRYTAFPNLHDPTINQDFAIFVGLLVLGMLAIATAAFWLSTFTVTGDEKGFHWQQLAFSRLGRRSAQGLWQDVRAFVTFTMRQGDGGDAGIFLLDMTNEALAWRITPKTPANVREAHERFVRLANEHAPLRDITASLKNLLESPETRSYEYAVTALSGPVPVPPAVRKILTTPVRVSHFLRGYLIVATILLALLVAAALLMQSGLIPPNAF
jgi:hypothetical protein